jgi:hypothetical protein
MEKKIQWKQQQISKEQIATEFKERVYDLGFSQTKDTKIARLIELYWLNNFFIA